MGRPLNKKFFGNRNIGTAGTTDDSIGGGAVATFTVATGGTYQVRPTATVASFFPGGVPATGTTTLEVDSAVVTNGGGAGTANYVTGDIVTVTSASGEMTFTVTANGNGEVTAVTPLARGSFASTLLFGAQATTTNSVAGAGCTLTLTYRVISIQVATAGSGHKVGSAVTITGANTGSAATATVATIAADTGAVGSATNQENAIIIRAKTTTNGTVKVGDIVRQVRTRGYKVKTDNGIAVCNLVATTSPAYKQAYIVATATGGTYYVTKLTAHHATLTTKTGDGALNGKAVKWTFGAPSATKVQIENA
jgi:hypothetical protein